MLALRRASVLNLQKKAAPIFRTGQLISWHCCGEGEVPEPMFPMALEKKKKNQNTAFCISRSNLLLKRKAIFVVVVV